MSFKINPIVVWSSLITLGVVAAVILGLAWLGSNISAPAPNNPSEVPKMIINGQDPAIAFVKHGQLYDDTVDLCDALEGFDGFIKEGRVDWRTFKDKQQRTIVTAAAIFDLNQLSLADVNSADEKDRRFLTTIKQSVKTYAVLFNFILDKNFSRFYEGETLLQKEMTDGKVYSWRLEGKGDSLLSGLGRYQNNNTLLESIIRPTNGVAPWKWALFRSEYSRIENEKKGNKTSLQFNP